MKKLTHLLLSVILAVISLSSCSKEDNFSYPMSDVYGTWEGTAIKIDSEWIDITSYWYEDFQFSITFYDDGTYYGRGYFGTGSGTYKAKDDVIYTYVDGKPYRNYRVVSLVNKNAELVMFVDGESETIGLKVKKR